MRWRAAHVAIVALVLVMVVAGQAQAASAACGPLKTRSLLLLSARTGATIRAFPGVEGVTAIATDGRGGFIVSGGFACVGAQRQSRLVRLDHRGLVDASWQAALPGGHPAVGALVRAGSTLYATGGFGVVALDAATGARRWVARISGGTDPAVLALAANASDVYLGGGFQRVDGAAHAALVELDARTGRVLGWQAPVLRGYAPAPIVDALALDGSRLYLGGNTFTTVAGRRRPGFAAVDARSGQLLAWTPGTAPGLNPGYGVGDVETIVAAGGLVFSAGHDGFGIVSARTGAISGWMRRIQGVGDRFTAYGSVVYLAGNVRNSFGSVGHRVRNNLAAIDIARGAVLPFAPKLPTYVGVQALAADRDEVLVGGDFESTLG